MNLTDFLSEPLVTDSKILYYKLVGRIPVPADALSATGGFGEKIKHNLIKNKISVSTVFLVIDHNYSRKGAPILFETMVFGGRYDGLQFRYSTIEEAEAGHKVAYFFAKKHIRPKSKKPFKIPYRAKNYHRR